MPLDRQVADLARERRMHRPLRHLVAERELGPSGEQAHLAEHRTVAVGRALEHIFVYALWIGTEPSGGVGDREERTGDRVEVVVVPHRIEGERIGEEADRVGQPDQQRTVTTNYRLRVLPTFSLLSSVGWENIHDPTLSDEPCGYTWDAGFAW